jgi:hypothetical protein
MAPLHLLVEERLDRHRPDHVRDELRVHVRLTDALVHQLPHLKTGGGSLKRYPSMLTNALCEGTTVHVHRKLSSDCRMPRWWTDT